MQDRSSISGDAALSADQRQSLGVEVRPPFPKGFEVERGDWSLPDAVRARPKLYREVP